MANEDIIDHNEKIKGLASLFTNCVYSETIRKPDISQKNKDIEKKDEEKKKTEDIDNLEEEKNKLKEKTDLPKDISSEDKNNEISKVEEKNKEK